MIDVSKYYPLAYRVAQKEMHRTVFRLYGDAEFEDAVQEAMVGLCKYMPNHDPAKAKELTYAYLICKTSIRSMIDRRMSKKRNPKQVQSINPITAFESEGSCMGVVRYDSKPLALNQFSRAFRNNPTAVTDAPHSDMSSPEAMFTFIEKHSGKPLTPRQKEAIKLYFFDGLNYAEISERFNCSRERVRQLVLAVTGDVKKKFQNRGVTASDML